MKTNPYKTATIVLASILFLIILTGLVYILHTTSYEKGYLKGSQTYEEHMLSELSQTGTYAVSNSTLYTESAVSQLFEDLILEMITIAKENGAVSLYDDNIEYVLVLDGMYELE